MSNAATNMALSARERLELLSEELLPLALGSLYHAALYVAATGSVAQALEAADLADEQGKILDKLSRASLIPFTEADPVQERRNWLDSAIERIHDRDHLLGRYWDLHQRRTEFLPTRQ